MIRLFTKNSTGIAPDGRWFAGDVNALQDAVAAILDYTQTIGTGALAVGESGLQLLRFGAGEARLTGHLRADGILRGLSGIVPGAYTTTTRNAIAAGQRPYGMAVLNTTTNQWEWNNGTDPSPTWVPMGFDPTGSLVLSGTVSQVALTGENAAGNISYRSRVAADTNDRFQINADGKISWGTGAAALDTNMYRNAAGVLRMDGAAGVGAFLDLSNNTAASLRFGTAQDTVLYRSAAGVLTTDGQFVSKAATNAMAATTLAGAGSTAFYSQVTGDAQGRFFILADGKLNWGPGTGATDTAMRRTAAGVLQVDGSLRATGTVYSNLGVAGAEMRLESNLALYFGTGAGDYLYRPSTGLLATGGRLQVAGLDVHRNVRGANGHVEGGTVNIALTGGGVGQGTASASFVDSFNAISGIATGVYSPSSSDTRLVITGLNASGISVKIYGNSGETDTAYWVVEGTD